jgi:hypothetical protein
MKKVLKIKVRISAWEWKMSVIYYMLIFLHFKFFVYASLSIYEHVVYLVMYLTDC